MTDSKNTWAASDKALKGLGETLQKGVKPDFTVTAATLRDAWDGGFIIAWETVSAGFGELTVSRSKGKVVLDSERMGKEFCKAVFAKFVEGVELV